MKRLVRAVLLVALLCTLPAVPAFATPPTPASGTWWATGITPEGCYLLAMDGTFTGTATLCPQDSTGVVNRIYFTGSVEGQTGSVVFRDVDFRPNGRELWTLTGGSGGLANLHGHGVVLAYDLNNPVAGTYQGQIHFGP